MATTYSIRDDRMMDQEFVLRFIAVCYYGIEKYKGVPDNYLNGSKEKIIYIGHVGHKLPTVSYH